MEGIGQGYQAFVERLQSDFASSSVDNAGKAPYHNSAMAIQNRYPPYPPKYAGYTSSNAFNIKREPLPSPMSSPTRSGAMQVDEAMQENVTSHLPAAQLQSFSTDVNCMPDMPPRHRGHHRRAHSEIPYRVPDDNAFDQEPGLLETPTLSDETSDDLFSMYIDVDKVNSHTTTSGPLPSSKASSPIGEHTLAPLQQQHHARSFSVDGVCASLNGPAVHTDHQQRTRHQHSNSMDGPIMIKQELLLSESLEAKKAMAADKLAELALLDPKRAKRILANRQSAARSKERKMRYISELECKVQTLQIEATTLSAQLTMLRRDTSGLTSENSELKLRLQSMEQQAQLRDALNDALRDEVQRLKLVTGQLVANSSGQSMQFFQHMLYNSGQVQQQKDQQQGLPSSPS